MKTLVSIVEGDGEVTALPVLLRRFSQHFSPGVWIDVATPIRVHRDRFLNRTEEFRRMLLLASAKCGEDGWVLILLDADDDCPVELAASIRERASEIIPHRPFAVVLAKREFEAWFIASARTLHGKRGFRFVEAGQVELDPEGIRGAKEWLSERIPEGRYREATDQAAFAALIDIEQVRARSRSFRKLCDEWLRQSA